MTGVGGPQFDFTINLTTILGIIVWLVTLAIAWSKFGGRIDMLEFRVTNIEKAVEKIATTLVLLQSNEKQIIVMSEHVASIQKEFATLHATVEQLRRGEGYVTGPRRGNIEGEYSRVYDAGR